MHGAAKKGATRLWRRRRGNQGTRRPRQHSQCCCCCCYSHVGERKPTGGHRGWRGGASNQHGGDGTHTGLTRFGARSIGHRCSSRCLPVSRVLSVSFVLARRCCCTFAAYDTANAAAAVAAALWIRLARSQKPSPPGRDNFGYDVGDPLPVGLFLTRTLAPTLARFFLAFWGRSMRRHEAAHGNHTRVRADHEAHAGGEWL